MREMRVVLSYLAALVVTVVVYGAIPFLSIPSLGATVWTSGFAQSFVNAGWPSFKAINFGIPAAAPIAFGLAGAFLQSAFIYLFSLQASDAYALGAVVWLALALFGCVGFCRMLGVSPAEGAYFSLLYLTLPIVWDHDGFAMVSFGFALLPLYVLSALRLTYEFHRENRAVRTRCIDILLFVLVSFLAVFMDGYTFVMFVVSTVLVYCLALTRGDASRGRLLLITGPVIIVTIAASYGAYTHYVGVSLFTPSPIDTFRRYGVDMVMMLLPCKDVSWLCDALHLSVDIDRKLFGDISMVWSAVFCAPFLISGALGFYLARRHRFAVPLLFISFLGFYFSLGPSLKVNSLLSPERSTINASELPVAKHFGLIATGNALFWEHVPGFMSMRATYRWAGLLFVGCFGLTVLLVKGFLKKDRKALAYGLPAAMVILFNIPDLHDRIKRSIGNRKAMEQMIVDLQPLNASIKNGRSVLFYPMGDDFIVNYLSAMGGYYTYNAGGDKNVELASKAWPIGVRTFFASSFNECLDQEIAELLLDGDADYVVIPYFDKLWNAGMWPPDEKSRRRLERQGIQVASVSETRAKYAPTIFKLASGANFVTKDEPLYAVVSVRNPVDIGVPRNINIGSYITFETCSKGFAYLKSGWSVPESWGIWSDGDSATMVMRVQSEYNRDLNITIEGYGFVNDRHQSQDVDVYVNTQLIKALRYTSSSKVSTEVNVPIAVSKKGDGLLKIEFKIKNPTSPAELGTAPDPRKLGFGLVSLKLDLAP